MEFNDDMVEKIISHMPLKGAIQSKVLSKKYEGKISNPNFSKILFQNQQNCSAELIYSSNFLSTSFYKISLNPSAFIQCSTYLSCDFDNLASCNGLILVDFEEIRVYSIFNPTTREHQLIPYPPYPNSTYMIGYTGLAVDYPNSDTYKLVTITDLAENFNCFYKFHVLSLDRSDVWREIQLRANTFISLSVYCPPVYWHNYLYWLRSDSSILSFDTKREESILIDRPQFVDQFDLNYGKILTGHDIWLGAAQGLLTLVSIFKKSIFISTCNDPNNNWTVSHILDNFILGPQDTIKGFPVLIDCKEVYFVVQNTFAEDHLYEYDTKTNGYKKVKVLNGNIDNRMFCFHQTLACVHKTPFHNVTIANQEYIAANLNGISRFITEDTIAEGETTG